MKKFFAAVVCCALFVANVSAQESSSVVEAPAANVALASAQEPVAPEAQNSATDVVTPAATIEAAPGTQVMQGAAPAQVVEGVPMEAGVAPVYGGQAAPVYGNSGCGCGSGVVSYAAPADSYAAPVATNYAAPVASGCCGGYSQPAASCCPSSRGMNFNRPHIIRNFGGRLTSIGGRNNCCN